MATQLYTPLVAPAPELPPVLTTSDSASGDDTVPVRADKRSPDTFRPIHVRTGQHSQASGSAVVEVGRTKVVCSLYGPRSYTRASTQFSNKCVLNFDVKFAPFSSTGERRERGQQADEREMSLLLGQVLSASVLREKYPKSAIDVFVMVVEDDGGALGAAITAASLSFADAGVELLDLVTACSVGSYKDTLILDPQASEKAQCSATTTMACMPGLGEVTYAWHAGQMSVRDVAQAMTLSLDGCSTLYNLARRCLLARSKKKAADVTAADGGTK